MMPIPISLAAEGDLDEQVLRRLIMQCETPFAPGVCYGRRGKDHLRENIGRFNYAALHVPFIVLADLDREDCAPGLIDSWLPRARTSNLILRIAVREVEAWLFADRARFAEFLGVAINRIPQNPDECDDPKQFLVNLARSSRFRQIREDLIPKPLGTNKVGKNYVGQLIRFVTTKWRSDAEAQRRSPSLHGAITALKKFSPMITGMKNDPPRI